MALVISASGGEPCWISGSQLLRVSSVDSKHWNSPSAPADGNDSRSRSGLRMQHRSVAARSDTPASPDTAAASRRTPGSASWCAHQSHIRDGCGRKSPVAPGGLDGPPDGHQRLLEALQLIEVGGVVEHLPVGEVQQPKPRGQHAARPQQRNGVELHLEHRLELGKRSRLRRRLTRLVVDDPQLAGGCDVDSVDEPAQQGAVGEFDLDALFAALAGRTGSDPRAGNTRTAGPLPRSSTWARSAGSKSSASRAARRRPAPTRGRPATSRSRGRGRRAGSA